VAVVISPIDLLRRGIERVNLALGGLDQLVLIT
jgi:hypothetical protein